MKKKVVLMFTATACWMLAILGCSREWEGKATQELLKHGGELFAQHCAGCHPNGENAIYSQKTLHRIDLTANGITTPVGIVSIMRNPGKGMKQFDRTAIPDNDAFAIAQYIIVTFK